MEAIDLSGRGTPPSCKGGRNDMQSAKEVAPRWAPSVPRAQARYGHATTCPLKPPSDDPSKTQPSHYRIHTYGGEASESTTLRKPGPRALSFFQGCLSRIPDSSILIVATRSPHERSRLHSMPLSPRNACLREDLRPYVYYSNAVLHVLLYLILSGLNHYLRSPQKSAVLVVDTTSFIVRASHLLEILSIVLSWETLALSNYFLVDIHLNLVRPRSLSLAFHGCGSHFR